MVLTGSINTSYYTGKVPGLLIKVVVSEERNGALTGRKVHFAALRVGQQDTRMMKAVPGEDENSLLLMTNMKETGDFFFTFPAAALQGAWLSLTLVRVWPFRAGRG